MTDNAQLLRPQPETISRLFSKIFTIPSTINIHSTAPLLEERLMYLQYWADSGAAVSTLRCLAQYLLAVIQYLDLHQLRMVTPDEIGKAADCWVRENLNGESRYLKFKKGQFVLHASKWVKMLGYLTPQIQALIPFAEYLNQYTEYMQQELGLAESTIAARGAQLKDFLINISAQKKTFAEITPLVIDEILIKKHSTNHYARKTIRDYASDIRLFLRYAENQGWCQKNLASSIKSPRVYRDESLPYAPSWNDIIKLLNNSVGNKPIEIRDYAILMLLTVYGLRSSEVAHLRLEDIDWRKELLHVRRAKGNKLQTFPLSHVVGEAILRYLTEVRLRHCAPREIFLCMQAPYQALDPGAVYVVVSKRLKALNLKLKHYGPHSIRHACATHLINEGMPLKVISDYLGHRDIDTTRIYAKVDLTNLRKVAEFDWSDVL